MKQHSSEPSKEPSKPRSLRRFEARSFPCLAGKPKKLCPQRAGTAPGGEIPTSCACALQAQPFGNSAPGWIPPQGRNNPSLGRKCALAGGRATKKTTWNAASAMRIPSQGRKPRLSEPRSETAISRPGREAFSRYPSTLLALSSTALAPFSES